MEYNCGFTEDNRWFRYRAAAIIVEDGCVLFAGNEKDDYYYSIGGAVHMGETAEDAVKREVFEEKRDKGVYTPYSSLLRINTKQETKL